MNLETEISVLQRRIKNCWVSALWVWFVFILAACNSFAQQSAYQQPLSYPIQSNAQQQQVPRTQAVRPSSTGQVHYQKIAHPTEYSTSQYPRDNDSDYIPYQPEDGRGYEGYPQDNDSDYVPYQPQGKSDPYYGYGQKGDEAGHEEPTNHRNQAPADNDFDFYPMYYN
ncbi:MAG: hypothetical protein IPP74_11905 [Alphaproteobacteria bacterium]|nr:hypothetical protein [Alphaproteobacteria bacterium]